MISIEGNRSARRCYSSVTAVFTGIACLAVNAARGQTTPEPSAKSASTDTAELADVVVTAQRRGERLHDVPISIATQTGPQLEQAGVSTTRDLGLVTPSLRMDIQGALVQPSIRGVTSDTTNVGGEANVAVYVDDVYQASQGGNLFQLPDVERVEVLKGPQGTLFGRNATGGAIRIFTTEPSFEPKGNLTVGYGRFGDELLKGFVTGPLIADKLAGGVAASFERSDGYYRNIVTGQDDAGLKSYLVRTKLLYEMADSAEFLLTGYYSLNDDRSIYAYEPLDGNTAARRTNPAVLYPTQPWEIAKNIDQRSTSESYGTSVRGVFTTPVGKITSITAASFTRLIFMADGDGTPLQVLNLDQTAPLGELSQEINFASEQLGPASVVGGLFYYGAYEKNAPNAPNFTAPVYGVQRTQAESAFAELHYRITDALNVIGGLRFNHEMKSAAASLPNGTPATRLPIGSADWNSALPRFAATYAISPQTNVYFNYGQGFKSGAFNTLNRLAPPVNPEKISAYEIGAKSAYSSVLLDAAAYYYDYKDVQVSIITGSPPVTSLQNAARERLYGLDLDGAWAATESFRLNGAVSYAHARYASYPNASVLVPNPDGRGGNVTVVEDLSGNTIIRSPNWSETLTAAYTVPLPAGELQLSGTLFNSSKVFLNNADRVTQPAYTLVNGEIAWHLEHSKLSLWGKNLSNEKVIQATLLTSAGDMASYAPPRTYGMQWTVSFGGGPGSAR